MESAQFPYYCDVFSFLKAVIPKRAQDIERNQVTTIPLVITCFDVCRELIFFGSNIGLVYGFHRGVEITSDPHVKFVLSSQTISFLKFASLLPSTSNLDQDPPRNTLVVTTDRTLLLYSLTRDKVLLQESIGNEEDGVITSVGISKEDIVVGTSHGIVYLLKVTVTATGCFITKKLIFREDPVTSDISSNHRFHSIIQIDPDLLPKSILIASCFRTIILHFDETDASKSSVIQVGQNKRKTCGPFGAVFMPINGLLDSPAQSLSTSSACLDGSLCIFAARPSSHLLRAQIQTGKAEETFILKKSIRPQPKEAFVSLKRTSSQRRESNVSNGVSPSLTPLQLGRLIKLTDSIICSWTPDSLVIFSTTGVILLEENDLLPITGVTKVTDTGPKSSGQHFEMFVLFDCRIIFRIRNFDIPSPTMTSLRQKFASSISMSSPVLESSEGKESFSIPHPFSFPLLTNIFNSLQVTSSSLLSIGQDPRRDSENREDIEISTYTEAASRKLSIPFEGVEEEEEEGPVVIKSRRRARIRSNGNSKNPLTQRQGSERSGLTLSRSVSSSNSLASPLRTSKGSVFSGDGTSSIASGSSAEGNTPDVKVNENPVDENAKLVRILDAYKQKNNMTESKTEETTFTTTTDLPVNVQEATDSLNLPSKHQSSVDQNDTKAEDKENIATLSPNTEETSKSVSDRKYFDVNLDSCLQDAFDLNDNQKGKDLYSNTTLHETIDMGSVKEMKWSLRISKAEDCNLKEKKKAPFDADKIISVSAFSDDMKDGVGILIQESKDACILIFPGFKKIKCPSVGDSVCVRSFEVNAREILLLYEDGSLYRCLDWSHKNRSLLTSVLPVKFSKLTISRVDRPLSLSFNFIDQLCWSCDQDGLGWILKLNTTTNTPSCLLARDDSFPPVRLTSVSVSPRNSAIVWGTDSCGRLFVREGIFNEKGDADILIAGINWVRVDIPFSVKSTVASNDSIWILCDFSSGDRLFERKGINPPYDYIGSHWQEYQLPASTSFSCFSGECHLFW